MIGRWKTVALGDVIALEYGKPLPKQDRSENGMYPAYGANGVKCRTNRYYHDKPTIIVGRKGSAGEVRLSAEKFWPLDVTYFVAFDNSQYDLRFLYYCLSRLDLPSLAKGVKPGINRNDVYSIECAFPPLAEQKRIVAILDDAFAAIAAATANTEKNIANARALFEISLFGVFGQKGAGWSQKRLNDVCRIFARGRSRHRPRNEPSLYGGEYPFIQTGDISQADHIIKIYSQTYSEVGLAQSRLWPKGTIGIAIVGATIGESGVLDFDACFPDSVIGMVVDSEKADPFFIEYLLQSFKPKIKAQGEGSARHNINLGTFQDLVFPIPPLRIQRHIVSKLDNLAGKSRRLEGIYEQKLNRLAELKQSILQRAFAGDLTADLRNAVALETDIPYPTIVEGISPTDLHAGILAIAYRAHEASDRLQYFGHVKGEKIAHMIEAYVGIDLGRKPIKDAAGPNDYPHLKKVEHRAQKAGFFSVHRNRGRYELTPLRGFDGFTDRVKTALGSRYQEVDSLIQLMLPMKTRQSEIFATTYAAWNNLLLDGCEPTDDAIVHEARENWHPKKLKIPKYKSYNAIKWIREKELAPKGNGKRVDGKAA